MNYPSSSSEGQIIHPYCPITYFISENFLIQLTTCDWLRGLWRNSFEYLKISWKRLKSLHLLGTAGSNLTRRLTRCGSLSTKAQCCSLQPTPISRTCGFSYYCYTDNSQIYLSFLPDDPTVSVRISARLSDISIHMDEGTPPSTKPLWNWTLG